MCDYITYSEPQVNYYEYCEATNAQGSPYCEEHSEWLDWRAEDAAEQIAEDRAMEERYGF